MNLIEKILPGLKKKEVVLRAYMVHDRGSEYDWKPELEQLCKNYSARVGAVPLDLGFELARLRMLASQAVLSTGRPSEELISWINYLEGIIRYGGHFTTKVFNITISVESEAIEDKRVDIDSLDRLRDGAIKVLQGSEPIYLYLE